MMRFAPSVLFEWLLRTLLLAGFALTAAAQTEIPIDTNLPVGDATGVCLLRLRIDGSADIRLKRTEMVVRTRSGREPEDAGSVCSEPIPELAVDGFRVVTRRGRGRVLLVENPADRNAYEAWVRVDDDESGDDIYEILLRWRLDTALNGGSLALVPGGGGEKKRWVPQGSMEGALELPGTELSSYENDALRYESSQSGRLEFRGRIDGVVDFFVRGDQLHADLKSGQPVKVERFRFTQPLPSRLLSSLEVKKEDGRGTAEIVQQPNPANSYTLVLRVTDPESGSDRYHWVLTWTRQ